MSGRTLTAGAIVAVAMLASATSADSQSPPVAAPPQVAAADPARTPDAAFVAKAVDVVAVDTELSRLAVARATSPEIKALARRVLDARRAIANDLKAMAGARQLTGPAAADATPPVATPAAALRAQLPAAFDAAYVAALRANAEAAVSIFEAESRDGRDDEIKEWAARQLPALRDHLTALRTLRTRSGS